jgi:hypothetical protein
MRKLHRTAFTLAGLALAAGTALSAAPPAGAATTALLGFPSGFSEGTIVNVNSGKCLEPSHEDFFGNGDLVVQRPCDGTVAQAWELVPVGTRNFSDWVLPVNRPAYHIVNAGSGLCLDDRDGVSSDGAAVQEWACNATSTTMMWGNDIFISGSISGIINLRASNKRAPDNIGLEVASGSTADNVPVQLFARDFSQPAQAWQYNQTG